MFKIKKYAVDHGLFTTLPKALYFVKGRSRRFPLPFVNKEVCINCGICEKVCPFINPENPIPAISVCAAKNKDKLIRIKKFFWRSLFTSC